MGALSVQDPSRPRAVYGPVRVAHLVHYALDRVNPAQVPANADLAACVRELDRAIHRLQAIKLSVIAAADRGHVAQSAGLTGTGAWVATKTHTTGAAAAGQVALATALDTTLHRTREALAEGLLSVDHARVIAGASTELPSTLTAVERDNIEITLLAAARRVDPAALRKTARRALAAARRSAAEVDAHEDRLVRSEEERAWSAARLTLHDNGDGTTTGHFTVPTLAASILRKVVQQLASPRRGRAAGGAGRADGDLGQADERTGEGEAAGLRRLTPADNWSEVNWANRHGQAFTQVLEHLPTERLHHKSAATIVVSIDLERLRAGMGVGRSDTGQDVSAATVRRLACEAGVLPAILGGDSQVLDVGRTHRYFSEHHRTALAGSYSECAAVGCDRPYAWTDLHHLKPWSTGGETSLSNAVPLCGHHHRRIHDPSFAAEVTGGERGVRAVTFHRRT